MDFSSSSPIYIQVMTMIKREIATGILPLGAKMPSGREIAQKYTINPNTASRVYKELETEGICFTRRGLGTFVTEDPAQVLQLRTEMAEALLHQFMDGMHQIGFNETEMLLLLQKEQQKKEKEQGGD